MLRKIGVTALVWLGLQALGIFFLGEASETVTGLYAFGTLLLVIGWQWGPWRGWSR